MNYEVDHPISPQQRSPRLARLTLHLQARLLDFGPGGPQVVDCDPRTGRVSARFPGHETAQVTEQLARQGFPVAVEGDLAVFSLTPSFRFEALDRLWGTLFEIL